MIKRRNIDQDTVLGKIGEWLVYDLTPGAANAFALAEQNPYNKDLIIDRAIVRVTTAGGTASSVGDMDVAQTAAGTGDSIFDGIDLNATAVYDSLNATDNGTNGIGKAITWSGKGGWNDYVTLKILAQNALTLVGKVYIHIIGTTGSSSSSSSSSTSSSSSSSSSSGA